MAKLLLYLYNRASEFKLMSAEMDQLVNLHGLNLWIQVTVILGDLLSLNTPL